MGLTALCFSLCPLSIESLTGEKTMNIIIRVLVALMLCLSGIAHAMEYNPKAGDGVERAAKALKTTPAAFIEANKAKLKAPHYWLYLGETYNVPAESVASKEVEFDKATALVRNNAREAREMGRTATVAEAIQTVQKQLAATEVAPVVRAVQVAEAAPTVRRAEPTRTEKKLVRTAKVVHPPASNDWSLPYREVHFGTANWKSVENSNAYQLGMQSVGGHWSTRTSSPDAETLMPIVQALSDIVGAKCALDHLSESECDVMPLAVLIWKSKYQGGIPPPNSARERPEFADLSDFITKFLARGEANNSSNLLTSSLNPKE